MTSLLSGFKTPVPSVASKQQKQALRERIAGAKTSASRGAVKELRKELETVRLEAKRARVMAASRAVAVAGGAKVQALKGSAAMQYIAAVINPEGQGDGVGVPDDYSDPTLRYQSINELSLGSTGATQPFGFDGSNQMAVLMTPDPRHHVYLSSALPALTTLSLGNWIHRNGLLMRDDNVGCGAKARRVFAEQFVNSQNTKFGFASILKFPCPEFATGLSTANPPSSQSVSTQVLVGACSNASGAAAVGIPCLGNAVAASADLVMGTFTAVGWNGQLPPSTPTTSPSMTITWSDTNGNLTETTASITVVASGTQSYSFALALPAGAVRLVAATIYPNATTSSCLITEFAWWLVSQAGYTLANIGSGSDYPLSGYILQSFAVPEYQTYADGSITAFRHVSGSAWLQYDGGTLNDNGRIVGALVDTRTTPFNKGSNFVGIGNLAAIKKAYDGQLPKGAYGVWVPQSPDDIAWRGFNDPWNWGLPYLSFHMFNNTTAGQQIRLRFVSNWELQTLSNIYPRMASVVDPTQIALMHRVLAGFPAIQENPLHMKAIGDFLRGLVSRAVQFAPMVGGAIGALAGGPSGAAMGMQAGSAVKDFADALRSGDSPAVATAKANSRR